MEKNYDCASRGPYNIILFGIAGENADRTRRRDRIPKYYDDIYSGTLSYRPGVTGIME